MYSTAAAANIAIPRAPECCSTERHPIGSSYLGGQESVRTDDRRQEIYPIDYRLRSAQVLNQSLRIPKREFLRMWNQREAFRAHHHRPYPWVILQAQALQVARRRPCSTGSICALPDRAALDPAWGYWSIFGKTRLWIKKSSRGSPQMHIQTSCAIMTIGRRVFTRLSTFEGTLPVCVGFQPGAVFHG